jgi:zinc transport system substrate-binding protein
MFHGNRRWLALAVTLPLLALTGCGAASGSQGPGADGDRSLDVVTSFYPLEFAAQRVGRDLVQVTDLTKAGAEPHDLELSARDVGTIAAADLVVYLHGFQPAVDEAVENEAADHTFDAASSARLEERSRAADPHFWLDPTRLADVADALASRLANLDQANTSRYQANAADLRQDLEALDADFEHGLASCASTDVVTSHAAFAYLTERYGLTQVPIEGLNPEGEPRPQDLAHVADFVSQHGVSTIYSETLVSRAVANTVASETGASTAVLDPLEGLTEKSAGTDYLEVMRANLETLRKGQGCS